MEDTVEIGNQQPISRHHAHDLWVSVRFFSETDTKSTDDDAYITIDVVCNEFCNIVHGTWSFELFLFGGFIRRWGNILRRVKIFEECDIIHISIQVATA
jgi:hypothetical protein